MVNRTEIIPSVEEIVVDTYPGSLIEEEMKQEDRRRRIIELAVGGVASATALVGFATGALTVKAWQARHSH